MSLLIFQGMKLSSCFVAVRLSLNLFETRNKRRIWLRTIYNTVYIRFQAHWNLYLIVRVVVVVGIGLNNEVLLSCDQLSLRWLGQLTKRVHESTERGRGRWLALACLWFWLKGWRGRWWGGGGAVRWKELQQIGWQAI